MALRGIRGIFLLAVGVPCLAQTPVPNPNGLADASMEELMNIQVTSVSKKPQRLASTAASVFVITAEDIRRSGISVLPELLRLAPGVQVARLSSGTWAIGIRGFNDEYSNKLLVLVDGRSVYNEFYSGSFWDSIDLPIDDIERIEVIRGPGAAIWGTNAVNGVINIISRTAKSTQGLLITGGAGTERDSTAAIRYGGQAGDAYYTAGIRNLGFDPYQIVGATGPSHGWSDRSGNFRMDWDISSKDSLQVSGDLEHSNIGAIIPNGTISNPTAPPADGRIVNEGGNLAVRWQHVLTSSSNLEVRFSFSDLFHNDPQSPTRIHSFDYSFQHHVHAGERHDIIWGANIRADSFRSTPTPILSFNPSRTDRDDIAIFGQDEIVLLADRLFFVAGAQLSHTTMAGYAIEPTGRLLWTSTRTLSSWIAVSRAVRTPSLTENGISYSEPPTQVFAGSASAPPLWAIANLTGNPAARSESVLAYEAGQRVQVSKTLSFDLSTFYNVYQHLITVTAGTPELQFSSGSPYLEIPVAFTNQRHGESYGTDLSATWNPSSRWRLLAGYGWLRVETHDYAGDTGQDEFRTSSATPHHQWQIRSNYDLTRTLQIDAAVYYDAAMLQTGIPQHLRGDLRLGWKPVAKLECSIGVQDAFEGHHLEYEPTRFNQISEIPRNFYAKVTWRF